MRMVENINKLTIDNMNQLLKSGEVDVYTFEGQQNFSSEFRWETRLDAEAKLNAGVEAKKIIEGMLLFPARLEDVEANSVTAITTHDINNEHGGSKEIGGTIVVKAGTAIDDVQEVLEVLIDRHYPRIDQKGNTVERKFVTSTENGTEVDSKSKGAEVQNNQQL